MGQGSKSLLLRLRLGQPCSEGRKWGGLYRGGPSDGSWGCLECRLLLLFPAPAGPPSLAADIRPSQSRVSEPWVPCKLPERIPLVELSEASCVIAVLQILLGACVDVSVCERMGSLLSVLPGHPGLPPASVCTLRGVGGQTDSRPPGFLQMSRVLPEMPHKSSASSCSLCFEFWKHRHLRHSRLPSEGCQGEARAAGCLWMPQRAAVSHTNIARIV